jgi:cytochrome c biogenesis protein CcdA
MIILSILYFLAGVATGLLPSRLFEHHKEDVEKAKRFAFGLIGGFVFFSCVLFAWVLQFDLSSQVFQYTSLLIVGFFGLIFILPTLSVLFFSFLSLSKRMPLPDALKGALFGLAWTPVLSLMIDASAAYFQKNSMAYVAAMAFFYSLGVAVLLVCRAKGGKAIAWAQQGSFLRQLFGGALVAAAVFLAFTKSYFPVPGKQIEDQSWVEKQLAPLRLQKQPLINQDFDPFSRPSSGPITPEIYLGYAGQNSFDPAMTLIPDEPAAYESVPDLRDNYVSLSGEWAVYPNSIESFANEAQLSVNFKGNRVYMVLSGESALPLQLELDGAPVSSAIQVNEEGGLFVKESRLYTILTLFGPLDKHVLTITFPAGIKAHAILFTGPE